jgi:hypothetical protein
LSSLANINSLDTSLGLDGCFDSLLVFCRCLLGVPSLVPVVDAVEDDLTLPCTLCDDNEALGKGPVLETQKGISRSLKGLAVGWRDEVGWWEGFGGFGDL